MLTNKGKYGLKALVHLSRQAPDAFVLAGEIAAARSIPRKFLEAIMTELRNAGYVASRKGKAGGYRLAQSAHHIRIGAVIRTLEGTLAPIACASKSSYERCADCDETSCEVRRLMVDVRKAICDVLDTRSLAELSAQAALTNEVLEELRDAEQTKLVAIEAAVGRIEEGAFGICVNFGSPISGERLDVVPHTPFCQSSAHSLQLH